jgi:hypothetical protein
LPELSPGLIAFLFGCAGGLGVTAYRLYEALQLPEDSQPHLGFLYFTIATVITLLGGVWALANHMTKPISPLTAFSVGVSIPAVLKAGADQTAKKRSRKKRID